MGTRMTVEEENALLLYSIQLKPIISDQDWQRIRDRKLVRRAGALLKADREQKERR